MSAINFPLTTTSLFVNTLNTNKIIYLPAASTIGAGRLFYIKDICGNAARSSIYISTIGMDRIENRFQPSTLYAVMSTNYGSVLMAPDGGLNWYFLQHYYKNAVSSLGAAAVAVAAFTPTSITGLKMWFDAADATTLTLSSGSVTQWTDKSGTGNTLTPWSGQANATVSSAYQNGLNVLNFSGNSLYRSPLGSAVYPQEVYIILAMKSVSAHNDVLGMGDTSVDNFNSLTFGEHTASRWHNGSSGFNRTPNCVSPTNETSTSFLLINWSIANNNFLIRRNGTQLVQTASYTYSFSTASTSIFQIGFRHTNITGSANFNGYIGEILTYNTQLGTTDRQKVEGYLAWRWGLQASLPSGHPYLSAAPGAFAPTSIATLIQWLDATDATTVLTGVSGTQVANGGSAGYWGDKSGNSNYVTTNTVAPTYSTSLIGGKAGLNFQSSAGMISTAFAKTSNVTLFLVGTVKSTRASWGTFWGHFTSGRHDADVQLRYTDGTSHINWHTNNNNNTSQLPYTFDSPVLYSCTMSGGTVMFMQQTNTTGTTSVTVTETLTWASGSAPVWIGRSDSNECINSYISEIVYFQSVLSTADRQKMEGYLAWKYGLQTYLPSGHPYLSAAP